MPKSDSQPEDEPSDSSKQDDKEQAKKSHPTPDKPTKAPAFPGLKAIDLNTPEVIEPDKTDRLRKIRRMMKLPSSSGKSSEKQDEPAEEESRDKDESSKEDLPTTADQIPDPIPDQAEPKAESSKVAPKAEEPKVKAEAEAKSESESESAIAEEAPAQARPPITWPSSGRSLRTILAGLLLGLFAGAYLLVGSALIGSTNRTDADMNGGDQRHNIKLAAMTMQIRQGEGEFAGSSQLSGWARKLPHYTDGVVSPLWPWVSSFLAPGSISSNEGPIDDTERLLFARGKWFLLFASCLVLLGFGVILLRYFTIPGVATILLMGGLGAVVQRCAYFQPEVLSYLFLTASWILALLILRRNGLVGYALLGITLGFSYLAKASIQPFVLAFVLATTWRAIAAWRARRQERLVIGWSQLGHLLGLVSLVLAFLVITGPRLLHSHRQFGDATHTYPSYWMWVDSFEEGFLWMQSHGDATTLKAGSEDAPTALTYLANHTLGDLVGRITSGTSLTVKSFLAPPQAMRGKEPPRPWKRVLERRGLYLGALCLLAIGMILATAIPLGWRRGPTSRGLAPVIFVLTTVVFSALAYGWYSPIGKGERFMLSLYLPLVLSLVWLCEVLCRRLPDTRWGKTTRWCYLGAQVILSACLVWRVVEILRHPEFS